MSALSATVPLCIECNKAFGLNLESPVSKIFHDLELMRGISDNEAELLIRWLWKIEGLFWIALNPDWDYSPLFSLRERVLMPINKIRSHLVLAISLIEDIDPSHGDKPMGVDSEITGLNAIFVSGVFSKVAMMVVLENFAHMIPGNFSQYKLSSVTCASNNGKFFHPHAGFKDDNEAVFITRFASKKLSRAHEMLVRKLQTKPTE